MIIYNIFVYNKAMMAQGIGGKASAGKTALALRSVEAVDRFIERNVNPLIEGVCIEMEVV